MGIRPRTKFTKQLKNRRCPKCKAKMNNQRVRCPKCASALSRPKK
jgi:rubredoxin